MSGEDAVKEICRRRPGSLETVVQVKIDPWQEAGVTFQTVVGMY